jgi:phage tail sheath protein FI
LLVKTSDPPAPISSGLSSLTYTFGSGDAFLIASKYPSQLGNHISVALTNTDPDLDVGQYKLRVYYKGNLVETFTVSKDPDGRDGYGRNIYLQNIRSNYITIIDNPATAVVYTFATPVNLQGGAHTTPTSGQVISGYDQFRNKIYPVYVFMDGGYDTLAVKTNLIDICETSRKYSFAILSAPINVTDSATDLVNWRTNTLAANTSRAALYAPVIKIYNKDADVEVLTSPDGVVGAIYARTFRDYEPWYAPAGFTRGVLRVLDVKPVYSEGEINLLYDRQVNVLYKDPLNGIAVWGQKTLQTKPSKLDRVNVRLLMNVIEEATENFLKNFIFEFNDELTRLLIRNQLESYLSEVASRRGLYDFRVVCDESNNTPAIIDANGLVVDVYVKPISVAEYIIGRYTILPSGMSFDEV